VPDENQEFAVIGSPLKRPSVQLIEISSYDQKIFPTVSVSRPFYNQKVSWLVSWVNDNSVNNSVTVY